jgi:hypothetical protein
MGSTIVLMNAPRAPNRRRSRPRYRSLARRYRVDSERQKNPLVQQASTESAEGPERLADRLQRFRRIVG